MTPQQQRRQAWIQHLLQSGLSMPDAQSAVNRYAEEHMGLPELAEEPGGFERLATLHLPNPSRLLPFSCCPDKDLVVVVSRLGIKDRLSLWKLQGTKKWDVEVDQGLPGSEEVVGLAWSPDGQSIIVAHHPPRLSMHSIQTGRAEPSMTISIPSSHDLRLTNIWWIKDPLDTLEEETEFPDLLSRKGFVPGSAHSKLMRLPLLDSFHDDNHSLSTTDLFGVQAGEPRSSGSVSRLSEVIESWPSLPSDLATASLAPVPRIGEKESRPGEELDENENLSSGSLVVISDNLGNLRFYLDGTYRLADVPLGLGTQVISLVKERQKASFIVNTSKTPPSPITNSPIVWPLVPFSLKLPLAENRTQRRVAQASSSTRELVSYLKRVTVEMRRAWYGDTGDGPRSIGPKWITSLEEVQRRHGYGRPSAVFDLTVLLATGRASVPLQDFLSTGEKMSDRGLLKWESTITDALRKLRDLSEKCAQMACQRIHLLLEEVKGWSLLPQYYGAYEFRTEDIELALDHAAKCIHVNIWLAAAAREELSRFREFMTWLRMEAGRANMSPNEASTTGISPKHDPLQTNEYIMSGLVSSQLDRWFTGEPARYSLSEMAGVFPKAFDKVLDTALKTATSRTEVSWDQVIPRPDLSQFDRCMEPLVEQLASCCQKIFTAAAGAAGRMADVRVPESLRTIWGSGSNSQGLIREKSSWGDEVCAHPSRPCSAPNTISKGCIVRHVAAYVPAVGTLQSNLSA
ncbi:hypothetical protein SISNIDRAFT_92439 [Sistotremastrum niveocremeum HHB9708]|uniref:Anaphase-promoting complex subunit 4 n=1 Tax=Sistotremastrum niveocremeum HHB9708 TaxID=1314777 RepID=A0A164U774_9AGAM|nr:hypothetical protein SISNIDRAFT_92439 [Sistotremastrum niveocremeum HHB9708]